MGVNTVSFKPRVINPTRIKNVVIFSADESLRSSGKALKNNMPWVEIQIISNPGHLSRMKSEHACVFLFDDMGMNFVDAEAIRRHCRNAQLVLLSAIDLVQCSPPQVAVSKYPYLKKADMIFALPRKESACRRLLHSVVRCAEDRLNINSFSHVRRFIFLVVDDEPRWTSQFLPVLYDIIGQRAAVKITRTFEETLEFLFGVNREDRIDPEAFFRQGHGDDVVCIITDIFFPKGRNLKHNAGRELIRLMDRFYPRIPKIVASKADEADPLGGTAFLLPKGDPGSLDTLREYIQDYTGLGDFILFDKKGSELKRARNIRELLGLVKAAEQETEKGHQIREVIVKLASHDFFSTWLYMHGFRDLGDKLVVRHNTGKRLLSGLKKNLEREITRVDTKPLVLDGREIHNLRQLLNALQTVGSASIQEIADTDSFSTWLDRKGFPELAEELRPVHGSGKRLENKLAAIVEKWMKIYQEKI